MRWVILFYGWLIRHRNKIQRRTDKEQRLSRIPRPDSATYGHIKIFACPRLRADQRGFFFPPFDSFPESCGFGGMLSMRLSTSSGVGFGASTMQVSSEPLDQVAAAIGRSVYWWGSIEIALRRLCVNIARFRDLSFTGAKAREALEISLSHCDTRQRIATAKALAFEAMDGDTYDEIEQLLNVIDNQLRQKRNRFVHDEWEIDGDEIVQRKHGAIVQNVQSRERKMFWSKDQRYSSVEEVHAFASDVHQALRDLEALDRDLDEMFREIWPPEEWPQPAPEE